MAYVETKSTWRDHAGRYFQITLGCLLVSAAFDLFLIPAHLMTGGISGIALIITYLTGLPVGAQNLVYNLPILYLAYRALGKLYAWDTIVGTVILSVLIDAMSFMVGWQIIDDAMLNAIFGGVVAGIGFGIVFRANANTGGLDVFAAVAKKYYSLDVGNVVFILNFLIVAASMFIFDIKTGLFSIVGIYLMGEFTNRVAAGFNREKSIVIISPKCQEICREIMENVHRGATYIQGAGGFAREPKELLYVVVKLTQVSRVKIIVHHYDPHAFLIISDASEVQGEGFTFKGEKYEDVRRKWIEANERRTEN